MSFLLFLVFCCCFAFNEGNNETKVRHRHGKRHKVMSLTDEGQTTKPAWPVKREAVIEGDLVLGGLMMVHEREETNICGPVMPQGGIQAVETMLYTLDIINSRLKHFKIGAHILDDCDRDTYGLEMAVDFIKVRYAGISVNITDGINSLPKLAYYIQSVETD